MPRALPLVVALLIPVAVLPAEDWPRWRGPRGDGTWNAPALPAPWPAEGLKERWRQRIGGGYAGIVVAGGRVFTMDLEPRPKGAADQPDGAERVLCFDADTGRPLWQHRYPVRYADMDYPNGPRSCPTVHAGRVYTLGAVGHVHCLEAATGKVIWAKVPGPGYAVKVPLWGLAAAPVLDGDRLLIHAGALPDGCLLALDRNTGEEVWRTGADPAGYATPVVIDHPAGRQVVYWTPENVRGAEAATGKPLWAVPYKVTYGVSIATPVYREGLVFVSGYWEGSKAIALGPDAAAAKLAWEAPKLCGLMATPLYRGGYLYTLDKSAGLVCVELKTGKRRWDDHRLTAKGRNPQATLVWAGDGDRALILNAAGELIQADLTPEGYRELARAKVMAGGTWSHPAFAGGRVYLHSDGADQARRGEAQSLVCVELPGK